MSPCMPRALDHLIAGALRLRLAETTPVRGRAKRDPHDVCKAVDGRVGSLNGMPEW
jgi:hypothetical protein